MTLLVGRRPLPMSTPLDIDVSISADQEAVFSSSDVGAHVALPSSSSLSTRSARSAACQAIPRNRRWDLPLWTQAGRTEKSRFRSSVVTKIAGSINCASSHALPLNQLRLRLDQESNREPGTDKAPISARAREKPSSPRVHFVEDPGVTSRAAARQAAACFETSASCSQPARRSMRGRIAGLLDCFSGSSSLTLQFFLIPYFVSI